MTRSWRPFPEVTHVVGQDTIDAYTEMSGDANPLHTDPEFAASGPFGTVIAHGPIALQAVFEATTTWLGVDLLPAGVMIDVSYRTPVRVGDSVRCTGAEPVDHAGALTVRASCVNQDGDEILQALIVVPRRLVPSAA
jgi:acyl dehydratase